MFSLVLAMSILIRPTRVREHINLFHLVILQVFHRQRMPLISAGSNSCAHCLLLPFPLPQSSAFLSNDLAAMNPRSRTHGLCDMFITLLPPSLGIYYVFEMHAVRTTVAQALPCFALSPDLKSINLIFGLCMLQPKTRTLSGTPRGLHGMTAGFE